MPNNDNILYKGVLINRNYQYTYANILTVIRGRISELMPWFARVELTQALTTWLDVNTDISEKQILANLQRKIIIPERPLHIPTSTDQQNTRDSLLSFLKENQAHEAALDRAERVGARILILPLKLANNWEIVCLFVNDNNHVFHGIYLNSDQIAWDTAQQTDPQRIMTYRHGPISLTPKTEVLNSRSGFSIRKKMEITELRKKLFISVCSQANFLEHAYTLSFQEVYSHIQSDAQSSGPLACENALQTLKYYFLRRFLHADAKARMDRSFLSQENFIITEEDNLLRYIVKQHTSEDTLEIRRSHCLILMPELKTALADQQATTAHAAPKAQPVPPTVNREREAILALLSNDKVNYYDRLGIQHDASAADITAAFPKRALHAHPDKGGNIEAMQRLQQAHETLSNTESRKRYDLILDLFEGEDDFDLADLLGEAERPTSEAYKEQSAALHREYQAKPLSAAYVPDYLKPLDISPTLYQCNIKRIEQREVDRTMLQWATLKEAYPNEFQTVLNFAIFYAVTKFFTSRTYKHIYSIALVFSLALSIFALKHKIIKIETPTKVMENFEVEENIAADNIYTFIEKLSAKQVAKERTYTAKLTPKLAVKLLLHFLKGEYFGRTLEDLKQYISHELDDLRSSHIASSEISLYEGILTVISAHSLANPGTPISLISALQKITDYAKHNLDTLDPIFLSLFADAYFRTLFSQAVYYDSRSQKDLFYLPTLSVNPNYRASNTNLLDLAVTAAKISEKINSATKTETQIQLLGQMHKIALIY